MPFRLIIPWLVLLLLSSHVAAQGTDQDEEIEPPPELFENVADSSVVEGSFSSGYLHASNIMMGRVPGKQVHLWRQESEITTENMFVPELIWLHLGVETELVDADTLTASERAYLAGHNTAVERMLKRDHGAEVFEKIRQESRAQYRLYKENKSVGSEDEHE